MNVSLERDVARRRGPVRLEGRSVIDDGGPFLARGLTFFWGLWGYQHDRARLEENLAWIARTRAVDYVRVLATVCGSTWSDRAVDPRAPGYDEDLAGLTDLAYDRYGLRLQRTIFGDTFCTPTASEREALIDRVLARGGDAMGARAGRAGIRRARAPASAAGRGCSGSSAARRSSSGTPSGRS